MAQNILELKNISKSFNGVCVLDQVNFTLQRGEVHALAGGNGAGKSTLMKILTGVYTKDSGDIIVDGKNVNFYSSKDAKNSGISMIFQEFSLIPTLTVAENIYLNNEFKNKYGLIDRKKCISETQRIFDELHANVDPNALMYKLDASQWQMTEIAKALTTETKILIMDEPTSCLTEMQVSHLFDIIRILKEKGIAIIYISHRMKEIYQICDKVSILADGKNVVTSEITDISMDELVKGITGKNVSRFEWQERTRPVGDKVVLEAKDINAGSKVANVSLQLHEGEVLGLSGLGGSGMSETLRALFGIDAIQSGELLIEGEKVHFKNPAQAMKKGIALVPEDRRIEGLIVDHTVKDNILLPLLKSLSNKVGVINNTSTNALVDQWIDELKIKTDSKNKVVSLLSGGNQQKIVFSKWLAGKPKIVMLNEPTKGIDIGSKAEIMDVIRSLAAEGKSVVIASSELAELLAICDRIAVMHNGGIVKVLLRKDVNSEEELQHEIQNF